MSRVREPAQRLARPEQHLANTAKGNISARLARQPTREMKMRKMSQVLMETSAQRPAGLAKAERELSHIELDHVTGGKGRTGGTLGNNL
jgi:hypothetical protein